MSKRITDAIGKSFAELTEARAEISRLEAIIADFWTQAEKTNSAFNFYLRKERDTLRADYSSLREKHDKLSEENAALRADAERLRQFDKWADQGLCPHMVFNDNGWWAVTFDGGGDMSLIEPPPDGVFTAIVESTQWRKTVVEAIDAAITARTLDEPLNIDACVDFGLYNSREESQ